MNNKLEIELVEKEKQLNEARKKYTKIKDIKSQEYKDTKEKYFKLAEEYSKLFDKYIRKLSKEINK